MPRRLGERSAHRDPFTQFRRWFEEARRSQPTWHDAMVLATAPREARPSARAVLLHGLDDRGFVFFSDYRSRKARELAGNPRGALVFLWAAQRRQVRVEGTVEVIEARESDAYFASRPRGHRLAVWASRQSAVIPGRDALERRMATLGERFRGRAVPRPPYWGGYRLVPDAFEFWQGRANRLHDRLRYRRLANGRWRIERLAP